jgi:hypothetical protein
MMDFRSQSAVMLTSTMKFQGLVFCCLLFAWNALAAWPLPDSAAARAQTRLSLAESYACSLNVWNKEIKPGAHDVKLREFHLRVEARLIEKDSSASSLPDALPSRSRFWLHRLMLQYSPDWRMVSRSSRVDSTNANIDWNRLRILKHDGRDLPITQLTPQDTLAQIDIHSTIAMSRNDLMRIAVFHFQPEAPGVYELHFQLRGKGRPAFETRQRVEFTCPLVEPQITLIKDGTLHEVSNPYIHIPLIASTFFGLQSPRPNNNETDRLFRTMFLGFMSKRLACTALPASLLTVADLSSSPDATSHLELAQQRAEYLLQVIGEKGQTLRADSPCGNSPGLPERETPPEAHRQACPSQITTRPPTPTETEFFLKLNESEVSPQWFAEENRVVPLVASPEVQRLIFEPVKIKPQEESDYVEFLCANPIPEAVLKCVRGGVIEVANVRGESCRQEMTAGAVANALRGRSSLRLDSPQMKAFLTAGEYTAGLEVAIVSSHEIIASGKIRFRVTRKQIVRDEVFALSPYDRVELTHEFDRERVARIAHEVLGAVSDNVSAASPEILVLITGHSDSLGEHRAQGVGRYYNLGLSFGRALYLKEIFSDSLLRHAEQKAYAVRTVSRQLIIPTALRESVRKHLGGSIAPGDKRSKREPATNGQPKGFVGEYSSLLIHEKARHFRAAAGGFSDALIPSADEIRARCEALRPLLPLEIVTLEISARAQKRVVKIVAVGFGAAVPFYRELQLSEELREFFCKMDYRSDEMPARIFGRDRYPAGRLMNRRVELNVIW